MITKITKMTFGVLIAYIGLLLLYLTYNISGGNTGHLLFYYRPFALGILACAISFWLLYNYIPPVSYFAPKNYRVRPYIKRLLNG